MVLKNEHYIWPAEKYHRSASQYKFLCFIFETPRDQNKSSCKDKQWWRHHPEKRGEEHKYSISDKCRKCQNHAWEKYRIFIFGRIDPKPQSKEEEKTQNNSHDFSFWSPKERPKYVSKYSPRTCHNTVWKMPGDERYMVRLIGSLNECWEK